MRFEFDKINKTENVERNAALLRGVNVRPKGKLGQQKAKYLLLEIYYIYHALVNYIKRERGKCNYITGKQIQGKALLLYDTIYRGIVMNDFPVSYGWLRQIFKRNFEHKTPAHALEQCDTIVSEKKLWGI